MIRIHLDDLQYMMPSAQFQFFRRWLEGHRALIVQPDPVRIPDHFMPGSFTTRLGRWGEDEPYPPYGGTRKLFEDAQDNPPVSD